MASAVKRGSWETPLSPVLTVQDRIREAHLVRRRTNVALVAALLLCVAVAGRVFDLQVLEFEHFRTLSESNRVSLVAVPPIRGLIYDRHGVVLAQNTPTYSLEITPEAVDDMDALVTALGELVAIDDADLERFHTALAKSRSFDSVPLRFRLSPEEVAQLAVNRPYLPGADFKARLARTYPLGPLAVHLVGYVGRIDEQDRQSIDTSNYRGTSHIGKTGVEHYYEHVLHGRAGYEHIEINAFGRTLRVLERRDPVPGSDIHLTIDAGLQAVAEEALGERNGAVVAIEPSSGAVLAFASVPTFDPNLFTFGIGRSEYRDLLHSPRRPLFNRALNGQYPPGSTIKPILALSGLEEEADTVSGGVYCRGWYSLPQSSHRYRDWKKEGHGEVDLTRAIVESCDVFFYQLALDLGIEGIHETLSQFGFGRPTGIDLSRESSGLVPSRDWKERERRQPWYPGETLIAGIGQGYVLTTPLQLASAAATLGTRGVRLRPQVMLRQGSGAEGGHATLIPEITGTVKVSSQAHWGLVIGAMEGVVHGSRGTARRVGTGTAYRMAGKTGTAQVIGITQDGDYDEERIAPHLRDHGLFLAFAPAERPRIAVAVVVENGGNGSASAAPIARRVLDYYLGRDEVPKGVRLMAGVPGQLRAVH